MNTHASVPFSKVNFAVLLRIILVSDNFILLLIGSILLLRNCSFISISLLSSEFKDPKY